MSENRKKEGFSCNFKRKERKKRVASLLAACADDSLSTNIPRLGQIKSSMLKREVSPSKDNDNNSVGLATGKLSKVATASTSKLNETLSLPDTNQC